MLYVSLFFMVLFWIWSKDDFERGNNTSGWFYLIVSAVNGASVISYIL